MSEDIQVQLVENFIECTNFSFQMDESTDISNCAQFITFVLYWRPIPSKYDIDWGKCIAICTDGEKVMTGHQSGLIVRLKETMRNATWRHYFLHREALAPKALPPEVDCVLKTVIKVVNSIKGKSLQTSIFRKICEDMGALFENLSHQSKVAFSRQHPKKSISVKSQNF